VSAADAAADSSDAADDQLPIFTYESIVVTASRYDDDVHLSHTNMPTNNIRRLQTAADIPMLLQEIPWVYSYSDAGNGIGYTYLKIRGFDQRRVAVLVNGIPLNDPEDHQVYWVDMPDLASSLEDVQVQRGITNGVGGVTAIGGSVNLVTSMLGDKPAGRAALETGSYGTNRRMISYTTGDLRIRHVGEQYLDNSGLADRTIDARTQADLSLFLHLADAGLTALDGMVVYLRILNLFDKAYETYGYFAGEEAATSVITLPVQSVTSLSA